MVFGSQQWRLKGGAGGSSSGCRAAWGAMGARWLCEVPTRTLRVLGSVSGTRGRVAAMAGDRLHLLRRGTAAMAGELEGTGDQ